LETERRKGGTLFPEEGGKGEFEFRERRPVDRGRFSRAEGGKKGKKKTCSEYLWEINVGP